MQVALQPPPIGCNSTVNVPGCNKRWAEVVGQPAGGGGEVEDDAMTCMYLMQHSLVDGGGRRHTQKESTFFRMAGIQAPLGQYYF